jgi:hypothetical protein
VGHRVSHEVELAPLPGHPGQDGLPSGLEPAVVVADDEFHAPHTAINEALEEGSPVRLGVMSSPQSSWTMAVTFRVLTPWTYISATAVVAHHMRIIITTPLVTVAHGRFEGRSFTHGNWTLGPEGQSFPQAEVNVGGTIVATGARHVHFDGCTVRHVGRYAIEFGAGCRDCTVAGSGLADLGAGGVLIGTGGGRKSLGTPARIDGPEAAIERIVVSDSTIRHGGRIHSAAVGVWIGHAPHCAVERCEIADFTYTGDPLAGLP